MIFTSCKSKDLNSVYYHFPIPDQIIKIRNEAPEKFRKECSLKCFFEKLGVVFSQDSNFCFYEQSNSIRVNLDRKNALNMISLLASYEQLTDQEVQEEIRNYTREHQDNN